MPSNRRFNLVCSDKAGRRRGCNAQKERRTDQSDQQPSGGRSHPCHEKQAGDVQKKDNSDQDERLEIHGLRTARFCAVSGHRMTF
jgi:hypothetical protein